MHRQAVILLLFGLGNSEQLDEQDDGLALLQTKLVREHAELNTSGTPVDANLQSFCSGRAWGDQCGCWSCDGKCLGANAKKLAGCKGKSALAGRTMHDACDAFNAWGDSCGCSHCSATCLGLNARKMGSCDMLPPRAAPSVSACTPGDTPDTMRHASSIWDGNAMGTGHGRGRLDSPQGWSSQNNKIGEWYQMDRAGDPRIITGVAIRGRKDQDQSVASFKVQRRTHSTGTWVDVDGGKVYTGNTGGAGRETQVDVTFDTPVLAQSIRIYPQTWNGHMSLRADIIAKCEASTCTSGNTPDTRRHASSIWDGNAMGTGHGRGRLDSPQGWSSQNNKIGEWYQMDTGLVGDTRTISGVAIRGRQDQDQSVASFKVQSMGATGTWTDVDGGKVYTGNKGGAARETQVVVLFDTPVYGRSIRIYPQTWTGHMSLRADIVRCAGTGTTATTNPGTTATTTNPGGPTNPGGKDCFGAIATWGPDFECNAKVSSFCADDSADGLDVSACCQDYCNSNQEKRLKKKDSEANSKEAEGERKSNRQESRSKRKDAESARKKQKKEAEWLEKRGAQETSNKKVEDERKTKRGYSESKRKNERSWKANMAKAKKESQFREAVRKARRAESAKKNGGGESTKKGGLKEKKQKKRAARKAKRERRKKANQPQMRR